MGLITTVVLDGDDTLWEMQSVFDMALVHFRGMMEAAGFDPEESLALQNKINIDLAHARGAAVANFGDSMVAAYMELTDKHEKPYYPRFAEALQAVASVPSLVAPELIDGVLSALTTLSNQGYQLLILTAGEQETQFRKLVNTGILDYVDGYQIVLRKDADAFRDLLATYGVKARQAVMVGNSLRSDINPATEAGLSAIWINHGGWAYDREEMNSPWDVKEVQYFSDVPRALIDFETEMAFWSEENRKKYSQKANLSEAKLGPGKDMSSKAFG